MDLLKAFDLENALDRVVQLSSASLEEFPSTSTARSLAVSAGDAKPVVTAVGAKKAGTTAASWAEFDWARRHAVMTKVANTKGFSAAVVELYQALAALPDPTPILQQSVTLSARVLELEALNRELATSVEAAQADTKEVTALVEQHRALEAAHRELKESNVKLEAQLKDSSAKALGAAVAQERAAQTAAEVARLQTQMRTLRAEHEAIQVALFEATSKQEAHEGGRQRELDALQDELDASVQRVAELQLERDRLPHRLGTLAVTSSGVAGQARESPAPTREGARGAGDQAEAAVGPSGRFSPSATPFAAARVDALTVGQLPGPPGGAGDEFWERQLRVRNDQIATLQVQLEVAARDAAAAAARHDMALQAAAHEVSMAQEAASQAAADLRNRPTAEQFHELQTRAAALQQLVDVQADTEGWDAGAVERYLPALGGSSTPKAVHALLQERNAALAAQVAGLKRSLAERTDALSKATAQVSALEQASTQQQALVKQLEADLAVIQSTGGGRPGVAQTARTGSNSHVGPDDRPGLLSVAVPSPDLGVVQEIDPSTGQLGPVMEPSTPPTAGEGDGASEGPGDGERLLDIVVLQRDRFKHRVAQLEEEKGGLSLELSTTKRALESMRADNVALVEKVRYLEGYSQKALAQAQGLGGAPGGRTMVLRVDRDGLPVPQETKGHRYQCGPLSFELAGKAGAGAGSRTGSAGGVRARASRGDEEAVEAKYSSAYEARVNPFTAFQDSEMESRVRSLQLHDRALLVGSKLLAGSRLGRAFVALYALLLHVFIMVLLYKAMAMDSCGTVEYVVDGAQVAAVAASAAQQTTRALLRLRAA